MYNFYNNSISSRTRTLEEGSIATGRIYTHFLRPSLLDFGRTGKEYWRKGLDSTLHQSV